MNRRQKSIIIEFAIVIAVTVAAIVALINFRDYVNRTESTLAMKQLSQVVLQYRKEHSAAPPESYISAIIEELQGKERLGDLQYRARWIDFGAEPNEILAYVKQDYHSFIASSGYLVLRLDGRVEWMEPKKFEELFAKQQKPMEKEFLKK